MINLDYCLDIAQDYESDGAEETAKDYRELVAEIKKNRATIKTLCAEINGLEARLAHIYGLAGTIQQEAEVEYE